MADDLQNELESDPIYLAAAEWLVRLQQPSLRLEETVEWQHWKNADPRHAQAFERLEELWNDCEQVEWPAPPSGRAPAGSDYEGSEPVGTWLARQPTAAPEFLLEPAKRAKRATWALAAALLVVAGAGAIRMFMVDTSHATSFETPIGANRTVTLADGSVVELAGHSRCEVKFDRDQRVVILERGEALFQVAKDSRRPFRVRAGNASVEAVGTEFDIRRNTDRVVVSVVEGRVLVQPVESVVHTSWVSWTHANGEPLTLGAGNQTTVNGAGIESRQAVADTQTALSWRHGRLAFERERLRDVVEDVNRYSPIPIVLDDPRMGETLITGTVSGSDIEGWLASLQPAFGLRVERHEDRILLKSSVPPLSFTAADPRAGRPD